MLFLPAWRRERLPVALVRSNPHLALSWAAAHNGTISKLIEGEAVILSQGSDIDEKIRKGHLISNVDLDEALRAECLGGLEDLAKTKRLHLEPSGKISVVKRDDA